MSEKHEVAERARKHEHVSVNGMWEERKKVKDWREGEKILRIVSSGARRRIFFLTFKRGAI